MAIVYRITNAVNQKRYVGVTTRTLSKRKSIHLSSARNGRDTKICRAIRKHGEKNFRFEVLKDGLTNDEAYELEQELIAIYNLKSEYNGSDGGEKGSLGAIASEEKKRKLSEMRRGKKRSPETVANVRAAVCRAVICANDGKRYQSVYEAAQAYGLSKCFFGTICKSTRPTSLGLRFYYEDEGGLKDLDEEEERRIKERSRAGLTVGQGANRKKVICLDDGLIYESAIAAAEHYGVERSNICAVCVGKVTSAGNRHFAYYYEGFSEEDRTSLLKTAVSRKERAIKAAKNTRAVVCITDGRRFATTKSAAKECGMSWSSLSVHLRKGRRLKNGLKFEYEKFVAGR